MLMLLILIFRHLPDKVSAASHHGDVLVQARGKPPPQYKDAQGIDSSEANVVDVVTTNLAKSNPSKQSAFPRHQ